MYLPRRKFSTKYTIPFIIFVCALLIIGQLIIQFIPVEQLNKVSGTITGLDTRITSYSHQRSTNTFIPSYSLVITLDNMRSYNLQETAYRNKLGPILHKGDQLTIYYPTTFCKVLSAGFIRDIAQIQSGNKVFYTWREQQKGNWLLIGMYTVALSFFYWFMRNIQKNG